MFTGAFTSYIDLAQVALYAFWLFFAGLIFYLRREDRREGYPLMRDPADRSGRPGGDVIPFIPEPKTFALADGGTATSGRPDNRKPNADRFAAWPGAPLNPRGDAMRAEVGPGSYAEREDKPELTVEGQPLFAPLRVDTAHWVDPEDPDPRGMTVVGADERSAGTVFDIWVDRAEPQIAYLEVALERAGASEGAAQGSEGGAEEGGGATPAALDRVLVPINFAHFRPSERKVEVDSLMADHFASVPRLKNPDRATKLEEDRIMAYYAAGTLYAEPSRVEPLL